MILAVDTSTEMLGVALFDGQRIIWETERYAHMRHTVELAPTVEEMLQKAGVAASELTALAVALGPGSFTALRIGIAFVVGMAQACQIPMVGVPTFDVLAAGQPAGKGRLVGILRAGRGRVVAADFLHEDGKWRMQGEPRVCTWTQLTEELPADACVCGEMDKAGITLLEKRKDIRMTSPALNVRRASVLATLAAERLRDSATPISPIKPIYLSAQTPVNT
jgi:tRNA threonylcarbamoyladenosine biosynthesis protein TsaB